MTKRLRLGGWLTKGEPMGSTITDKQIAELRKSFYENPANKVAQNAVTSVKIPDLALNRNVVQNTNHTFSIKLDEWKVTSQKWSGRCWLFAALNLFRPGTMKKMNIIEIFASFLLLLMEQILLLR